MRHEIKSERFQRGVIKIGDELYIAGKIGNLILCWLISNEGVASLPTITLEAKPGEKIEVVPKEDWSKLELCEIIDAFYKKHKASLKNLA